jgi:hypothetical protein
MTFESGSWRALHEVAGQVVAALDTVRISSSAEIGASDRSDDTGGVEFRGALRLTEMASMLRAKTIVINGTTCTGRA